MTEYLNQILYNNKKFDSSDTIRLLEPYMYSTSMVKPVEESVQEPIPIEPIVEDPIVELVIKKPIDEHQTPIINPIQSDTNHANTLLPRKNNNIISPRCTDTLFWCMYIATYGYGDYLSIGTKYKNKEIEKKQEMIDIIKKNPLILKSTPRKITNVAIQEIMAELMIDKKTTMNSFFAMCVLNKLHVYIIDTSTKTFLEFGQTNQTNEQNKTNEQNEEDPTIQDNTYLFYRSIEGFYSIDLDYADSSTDPKIIDQLTPLFELEHGPKPMKSISNYKVDELETISKKLGLWSDAKKYKKQDLYQEIFVKCIW